jgi:hypothetical protein
MADCQKMQSLAHRYTILHWLRTTGLVVSFQILFRNPLQPLLKKKNNTVSETRDCPFINTLQALVGCNYVTFNYVSLLLNSICITAV